MLAHQHFEVNKHTQEQEQEVMRFWKAALACHLQKESISFEESLKGGDEAVYASLYWAIMPPPLQARHHPISERPHVELDGA